jgi:hypothetical protein
MMGDETTTPASCNSGVVTIEDGEKCDEWLANLFDIGGPSGSDQGAGEQRRGGSGILPNSIRRPPFGEFDILRETRRVW